MGPGLYFDRSADVQISKKGAPVALSLAGLRLEFVVSKSKDENVGTVKVYNVSETTGAKLSAGLLLTVSAGYKGRETVIFSGDILDVKRGTQGPDTVTEISARTGASSLRSGVYSFSYGRAVSAFGVLRDLGARIGIPLDLKTADLTDRPYSNGWAFTGKAIDAIREVAERVGGRVVQYSGALVIASRDESVPASLEVALSSSSSGLLGSPVRFMEEEEKKDGATGEKTKKHGWQFSNLIDGRIVHGGLVQINSASIPGDSALVTVGELRITGDTHGQAWQMDVKGYDKR